jgi:mono/diheme cytochrome c family protein
VVRAVGVTLGVLAGAVVLVAAWVYVASERMLRAKYDVPSTALSYAPAQVSAARGEHLVRAFGSCTLCHGEDLGGGSYGDPSPIGVVAGPNLTRGRGGLGATNTDADWVRGIRYGVHADSTSLIIMPSEVWVHFSDADLASIIAYLKSLPPVDREVPRTHFKPLGRALLAAGKLSILVAPKTPRLTNVAWVPPEPTPAYGRYIADVSGCHGCHGFGLSGGRVAGPPGLPPASNLTPDAETGIASWEEADFVRALRTGKRPDGTAINDFMPWQQFRNMTDDELHAVWVNLRSVPPKTFGGK